MPKYTSHILFNFSLLIILFIIYQRYSFPLTEQQLILFLLSYFIGTVYLTPDIDTRSEASRRCGISCTPYRWFFTHRGISHHWLYGILTRIIYVLLIIGLLIFFISGLPEINTFINTLLSYKIEMLFIITGLFLSNLFHIILDTIF